jgi:hypothetical protein
MVVAGVEVQAAEVLGGTQNVDFTPGFGAELADAVLSGKKVIVGSFYFRGTGADPAQVRRAVKNIVAVGGDLQVHNDFTFAAGSDAILEFTGLKQVGGYVAMFGNSYVVQLSFPELLETKRVQIYNNPKLATVDLSSLTTVGGNLQVYSNKVLQSVDLRSVEAIAAGGNGLQFHDNHASFSCNNNNASPAVAACKNKAKSPTCSPFSSNPSSCI